MKINCLGCGKKQFELDPPDVETLKIITFICSECGEHTSIGERQGGGIVVAVDMHGKEAVKKVPS